LAAYRNYFERRRTADATTQAGKSTALRVNNADEEAVAAFLDKRLNFGDIPAVIDTVMNSFKGGDMADLSSVLAADAEARACTRQIIAAPGAARQGAR
jgi:1-deoxy-D-xylulose-5-phosphate reductoisomerase